MPSFLILALALAPAACDDEPGNPTPIGPGGPDDPTELLVLNTIGQTMAAFEIIADSLAASAPPIDLGAGFDGVSIDATATHAVTTVSSFGGSRVLFADLSDGTVTTTGFPAPEEASANPSRASFDAAGSAWFAGRTSNAIYTAAPGEVTATRVATGVGTFVSQVLPVGAELFALDAFIDDEGGTFDPLGPSRLFVLDATGAVTDTIDLPAEAFNAIDMVRAGGKLIVLLGGTVAGPPTFAPNGDGGLVVVDPATRTTGFFIPLSANGVAIEPGADGLVYVTATNDFVNGSTLAVSFDPATGAFVRGPADPIDVRDAGGSSIDCWGMTALEDGRLLCVTFDAVASGRLLLLDANATAIDEVPSGFGSVDLLLR